jgi:hypothetical protein
MSDMGNGAWGMDVTGNKSQATSCKEDPCLGPAAYDLRREILRGQAARGGQVRVPLKVLWVML